MATILDVPLSTASSSSNATVDAAAYPRVIKAAAYSHSGPQQHFEGPFVDSNGNWYIGLVGYSTGKLIVMKSTDKGETWTNMDAASANNPTLYIPTNPGNIAITYRDNVLYFLVGTGASTITLARFGTSGNATADEYLTSFGDVSTTSSGGGGWAYRVLVRSNGDVVALYNKNTTGYPITYRIYSGGAWGTETTLISRAGTATSVPIRDAVIDSADYIHILYADNPTGTTQNYTWVSFSSSNVLGTAVTLVSGAGSVSSCQVITSGSDEIILTNAGEITLGNASDASRFTAFSFPTGGAYAFSGPSNRVYQMAVSALRIRSGNSWSLITYPWTRTVSYTPSLATVTTANGGTGVVAVCADRGGTTLTSSIVTKMFWVLVPLPAPLSTATAAAFVPTFVAKVSEGAVASTASAPAPIISSIMAFPLATATAAMLAATDIVARPADAVSATADAVAPLILMALRQDVATATATSPVPTVIDTEPVGVTTSVVAGTYSPAFTIAYATPVAAATSASFAPLLSSIITIPKPGANATPFPPALVSALPVPAGVATGSAAAPALVVAQAVGAGGASAESRVPALLAMLAIAHADASALAPSPTFRAVTSFQADIAAASSAAIQPGQRQAMPFVTGKARAAVPTPRLFSYNRHQQQRVPGRRTEIIAGNRRSPEFISKSRVLNLDEKASYAKEEN